jgi:ADP-ribosylglycohydrolase
MVVSGAHVESMLMAGAAGDCVGFAWEGRPAPVEREICPERWRVSDDTILTLATCEGIVAAGRVTAESIAKALADSFRSRRIPGLGASTLRALRALESGSHWAMAGRSGEHAAGNGAAMRIAPLALFLSGEGAQERQLIRDVCRITHKNDEAYIGALAVILALHLANESSLPAPVLVGRIAESLPDTRVRDSLVALSALAIDADHETAAAVTGNGGHSAESVPLAIFLGLRWRDDAGRAITSAVRSGGDTDTIASIAGQIGGGRGRAASARMGRSGSGGGRSDVFPERSST